MKTPTAEQLRLAAEWLDANEAEDGNEQADCFAVRDWLRDQADKKEVRDLARQVGKPVSRVRQALNQPC